jgi:hypothetical protein
MVPLFTQEECDKIIQHADSIGWELGKQFEGNIPKEDGKSHGFKISWVTLPWIYKGIRSYLKNEAGLKIKHDVQILVNRYLTGDRNFLHNDCYSHPHLKYDNTFVTVTVLLNSEFEGGEFILQNKKVEQIVGYGYHHRSSIMHEITEITKGTRYSLIAFIKNSDIINPKTII